MIYTRYPYTALITLSQKANNWNNLLWKTTHTKKNLLSMCQSCNRGPHRRERKRFVHFELELHSRGMYIKKLTGTTCGFACKISNMQKKRITGDGPQAVIISFVLILSVTASHCDIHQPSWPLKKYNSQLTMVLQRALGQSFVILDDVPNSNHPHVFLSVSDSLSLYSGNCQNGLPRSLTFFRAFFCVDILFCFFFWF